MGIFLITERSNNMDCNFKDALVSSAYALGCRCTRCHKYYTEVVKKHRAARTVIKKELLLSVRLCCIDCGWNKEPNILQFHHEKNQSNDIALSTIVCGGGGIARLLEELAKGCFLCPTCHTLRHYNKDTQRVQTNNPKLR